MSISTFLTYPVNQSATAPSNPTGTSSVTAVMMGLAISFTPKYSGKLNVIVQGVGANSSLNAFTSARLVNGTGTAPVNGAAATGTNMGVAATIQTNLANDSLSYPPILGTTVQAPLIVGTTYWFDLSLLVSAGTGTIANIVYIITEFPA